MSTEHSTPRLGRYEILDEIGRGAMGLVYLAKDPLIGRLVALKTLRLVRAPEDDELEQFRRRFIREAQSAGILSHPNIVTIHDVVDESGVDGATFIAMEYVRGTDLKALIRGDESLDLDFVVDVVRQVADALDYAHGKGVVHRDIKPGNVLLTGDGHVKLTDFGIARLHASSLTLDHELLGTPNYMAPEQILGSEVDRRADIFSLGVVLYEMLTGQKPFQGENLTAVTHKIVYEDFTPPSKHVSNLPPGIETVLTQALAKKPDDRFQSGRELAEALARCVGEYREESSHSITHRMKGFVRPPTPKAGDGSRSLGSMLRAWRRGGAAGRPPVRRIVTVAVVTAILALLLGGWLLSRVEVRGAAGLPGVEDERGREYFELVREGRRLLEAGDPLEAREVLRQAERVAPERPHARELLEVARREAKSLTETELQITGHLDAAREAIKNSRFARAVRSTEAALALDEENEQALELHDMALALQRAEARQRTVPRPTAPAQEPAAVAETTPSTSEETSASRAAQTAERDAASTAVPTLETVFESYHQEQPVGTLSVMLGTDRLFRHEFRFVEKKGFLGLGREVYNGRLRVQPVEVPPGPQVLRVFVTPRGQPALMELLNVRFEPGDSRSLRVVWSETGSLSARLE